MAKISWEDISGNFHKLGEGEFCEVYASSLNNENVAVKVLRKTKHDKQSINGVEIEQQILMKLNHPNVIKLIGYGQIENLPFIVLEKLKDILSNIMPNDQSQSWFVKRKLKNLWPLQRSYNYALQLAKALEYCHTCSGHVIMHRDLKPNNIGITYDDRLVLFDFGLAHEWDQTTPVTEFCKLTGMTGSLRYMSPEVALCKPYGLTSEVFSFSIIFWQLISHKTPFAAHDADTFIKYVCRESVRPIIKEKWKLPTNMKTLLQSCWHENPKERPSFAEIVKELEKVTT